MKLAIGGKAAAAEAQRMVSEQIEASLALQARALTGGLGATALSAAAKTLDHYRQKVRANQTVLPKAPLDGHFDLNEDGQRGGDVRRTLLRQALSTTALETT